MKMHTLLLLATLSSVGLLASVSTVTAVLVSVSIAVSVGSVLVSVSISVGWLGVLGFTFVLDVSDVAVLIGAVGDDLSAAVGEEDSVRSSDHFAVAFGLVGVVVLGGLILAGVSEFVWHGLLHWTKKQFQSIKTSSMKKILHSQV